MVIGNVREYVPKAILPAAPRGRIRSGSRAVPESRMRQCVTYAPAVPEGEIAMDDPRASDVRDLLERHLAFANSHSPPEDVHALDVDGLLDPAITFFSFRRNGHLLGVGALKQIDERHAELKSMHTAVAARGRGIGRAMLSHLIGAARERGFRQVSLETGSMSAFAPARSLYASAGFRRCGPFGDYRPSRNSTFMTLWLDGPGPVLEAGG
jgi:putative acetyltransferase